MANGNDDFDPDDLAYFGNLLDQGVDPTEYTTIYDAYGDVLAEGTFEDLYNDSLLTAEEFEQIYGDYTITDLIYDLEMAYDIEWDWETWRELYGE